MVSVRKAVTDYEPSLLLTDIYLSDKGFRLAIGQESSETEPTRRGSQE